jgi:hypothetical protein
MKMITPSPVPLEYSKAVLRGKLIAMSTYIKKRYLK